MDVIYLEQLGINYSAKTTSSNLYETSFGKHSYFCCVWVTKAETGGTGGLNCILRAGSLKQFLAEKQHVEKEK